MALFKKVGISFRASREVSHYPPVSEEGVPGDFLSPVRDKSQSDSFCQEGLASSAG